MLTWAVALALGLGIATTTSGQRFGSPAKVPAPSELKVKEGTAEGHKSPVEVVTKAIKAAKADENATLKACLANWAAQQADERSWSAGNDKGLTNLQEVARLLAAMEVENMVLLEQNTAGNYAVVAVRRGDAMHMIRTVREAPENEEGTKDKKVQNWMLVSCYASDYRVDYNAPGVKAIRDAIEAGDGVKIKEYIEEDQRATLELLREVQEGVDPYDLLAKRLKKIIKNADKPKILLSRNNSGFQNVMAYWFHKEGSDTFLVLSFQDEWDWESKKHSTKVLLNLREISQFHTNAGDYFKQFVADFDWG
jgi:hypothetical protein